MQVSQPDCSPVGFSDDNSTCVMHTRWHTAREGAERRDEEDGGGEEVSPVGGRKMP